MAVSITEQWQSWWGTGDFVYHEGTFYTLQKLPSMLKEFDYGGIGLATSTDAIHFTPQGPHPFLPGRDCDFFHDQETGLFHLLTLGERMRDGHTSIKRLVSSDLKNWEQAEEPVIVTDSRFNPDICPHLFEWNGWYYLMAGYTTRSGVWKSRNQFGPWALQKSTRLDLLAVPKTAEFTDGRRIMAGFLEDRGWGGNLVFRELVQHEDGSLGTRFPPEMIPLSGDPLDLPFEPLTGGVSGSGERVDISAPDGFGAGMLTGVPQNVRITLNVKPRAGSSRFGLRMRSASRDEEGCELRFEPAAQRVQFGLPHRGHGGSVSDAAITQVEGLDRPFGLDIVLKHDIVDVCIDNRRTIVTRCWNPRGDRLLLFAQGADVAFDAIEIRPLSE